jgi:uncharacterized SAM-binding protein YcdF (DUF218 family)
MKVFSSKRAIPFLLCLFLVVVMASWRAVQLFQAEALTSQGYLVLGGVAYREQFAADEKKLHPDRTVLISGGSPDPCIYLMFQKRNASMQGVWLEHCAKNTFENFVYALPILEKLKLRKITLVTDYPQVQRAWPVAIILFMSHGIAVELHELPENGGDYKSELEIVGLATMACGWALISQVYQPTCEHLTHLPDTDMKMWLQRGFECEQQTGVESHKASTGLRGP